jgi:hypothetical protein
MSTAKIVLVLLFLFIAFGIVGRMDYEDAQRMARANGKEGIRLFCVHFPIDLSGERGPSRSTRGTALLVTVAPTAEIGVSAPTAFRCVVVEE